MTTPYTSPVNQTALGILGQAIPGYVGQLVDVGPNRLLRKFGNNGAGTQQVSTLTVSGATDSKDYTVTIQGIDVTANSGTGATTSTIATALAAAINAAPAVRGLVTALASTNTVIVTGNLGGYTFTVAEDDAQLSWAATTAAADASAFGFGLAACTAGSFSTYGNLPTANPVSGYTAQADTLDYTYNGTSTWEVTIEWRGALYSGAVVMATSKAATTAAMVAELNAILPASSVLAAASSDALLLTAEVAGESFTTSFVMSDLASTAPSLTSTRSLSTSIADAFAGINARDVAVEATSISALSSSTPAGGVMDLLWRGRCYVERDSSETISWGGDVYVSISGTDIGQLYATSSSSRVLLPQCKWERSVSTDLAVVRVNLD